MTVLRSVRVAAVQATPVFLDAEASVDKVVALLTEAAANGAELVVFPECFLSLYPSYAWVSAGMPDHKGMDLLRRRMWESAVEVPGPLVDRLVEACAATGAHCVIGVNEREPERSSSLFNTMLTIGPAGLLAKHRKVMPTHHERLFHALGAGDDIGVVDTAIGRIGGLICWENRMPLARYAVYRGAPQIYVAPTADDSSGWQATMRNVSIEAGAVVVSAIQYLPASAYPDDFPVAIPAELTTVSKGGTCIIAAGDSGYLAEPLYGEEGIRYADCDLSAAMSHKGWFDVTGHYSREDIFVPLLGRPEA